MNKYRNKKCEFEGKKFDSQLELNFYLYLLEEKEKGDVIEIKLQQKYELLPSYEKNGKKVRAINYIADFEVHYKNGTIRVIDTKGFQTADSKIKKKMFDYKFPYELELINYSRLDGGWITLPELEKARKERKKNKIKKIDKI